MAGYDDTRNKILETLLQRPVGTEIQPENHQDFALSLLDYIRSVELISGSTLIGIAYQDTVPVQSNDANEAYIAGVAQERTVVFQNFRDVNGDPLTVTTEEMEAKLVILIWNRQYWSKQEISANIVSQAENAYYFYNLTIRKQYASVAAMNADKVSPMGNDGRVIKRGEIVSVRNSSNSDEDAVYSYELDTEGNPSWVLQMKLSVLATRTIDGGSASVKLDTVQNKRDTKANWETNNPVLAEGEIGLVLDDKNSYKVGDGVTKWNDLPLRGYNGNVVSEFGDDFNSVMSQGGITNLLKYIVGNDNKIEIGTSNFDVLDNVKMAGFYVLTTNGFPAYHMLVTFDNMAHCFNQWIFGNLVLTNGTITDGAHTDGTFNIICRTYSLRTQNAGSDNVEITAKTWTKWRYLQSFFLRDKDGNIGNEEKTLGEDAIKNKITVLQNNIIQLVNDLESNFNDKILDVEDDYDYLLLEYQKLIVWAGKLENMTNAAVTTQKLADGAVTTQKLADNIQSLIANISENSAFAGIATPTTNPGTPDGPVFYIATESGTYSNFDGVEVAEGEAAILEWKGGWAKKVTGLTTQKKLNELELEVIKFSETKNLVPTEEQIYFNKALINNNKACIEIISEAVFTKLNARIIYADETPTEYKGFSSPGFYNIESDNIIESIQVYIAPNQIMQSGSTTVNIYRNISYDVRTALNNNQKNIEDIQSLSLKTDEAINGINEANKRITTLSYQIATLDVAENRVESGIYTINRTDSKNLIVNHGYIKSLKVTLPALYGITVILQLIKKDTNEVVSVAASEATKVEDYVYTYEIDNLDDYIYIRPVIYPEVFTKIDKEITDELFKVEITYKDSIVYLNPFLYSEYNYYLSYLFKEIYLDLSGLTEYNINDLEYIYIYRVEVINGYLKQLYIRGHFTGVENDIELFTYYVSELRDKTTDYHIITLKSTLKSLQGKGYIVFNKDVTNEVIPRFGKNGILKNAVRDSINSPYIYTKKYVIDKLANNSTVNPHDVINIVKGVSSSNLDLDSEDNIATAKAVYLLKTLIDELSLNSKVNNLENNFITYDSLSQSLKDIINNLSGGSSILTADNEDLSVITDGAVSKLKFADKNFSLSNHTGIARKFLRLKSVSDNSLSQEDFNSENTLYIIQYEHNIQGSTADNPIIIPNNCVILFWGGSLKGGYIYGNDTEVLGTNGFSDSTLILQGFWYKNGKKINVLTKEAKELKTPIPLLAHIYQRQTTLNYDGSKTPEGEIKGYASIGCKEAAIAIMLWRRDERYFTDKGLEVPETLWCMQGDKGSLQQYSNFSDGINLDWIIKKCKQYGIKPKILKFYVRKDEGEHTNEYDDTSLSNAAYHTRLGAGWFNGYANGNYQPTGKIAPDGSDPIERTNRRLKYLEFIKIIADKYSKEFEYITLFNEIPTIYGSASTTKDPDYKEVPTGFNESEEISLTNYMSNNEMIIKAFDILKAKGVKTGVTHYEFPYTSDDLNNTIANEESIIFRNWYPYFKSSVSGEGSSITITPWIKGPTNDVLLVQDETLNNEYGGIYASLRTKKQTKFIISEIGKLDTFENISYTDTGTQYGELRDGLAITMYFRTIMNMFKDVALYICPWYIETWFYKDDTAKEYKIQPYFKEWLEKLLY